MYVCTVLPQAQIKTVAYMKSYAGTIIATATVDAVLLKIKVVCHVGTLFLSVLLCIMFRASSYF